MSYLYSFKKEGIPEGWYFAFGNKKALEWGDDVVKKFIGELVIL